MIVNTSRRSGDGISVIGGLDSLELGQNGQGGRRAVARRWWTALWPKLLAVAIVLAAWQLFYLSNFHGDTADHLVKGPGAGLGDLWAQLRTGELWQAIGTTVQTAVAGYLLALIIGSAIGAVVSRIPPLRAATGSIIS